MKKFILSSFGAGLLWSIATGGAFATPSCPISYGAADNAKPNKLYLYFPTADDSSFPSFGDAEASPLVSPARKFDVSQLSSYTGSASDLINAIHDVVVDDYCELNVQVLPPTTTAPPTTSARRSIVAIGTDQNVTTTSTPGCPTPNCWTWGLAQEVDFNDAVLIDYARVWAGTYQYTAGAAGGALNGANSTMERWAFSIGGTAAHEAGHTYGLSHSAGLVVKTGEDVLTHHLMASGSHYSDEDRAGYRRHFSDNEFSIIAANVGLSIQTIHNWDFVNPNSSDARSLEIEVLSQQPSLVFSWSYAGSLSPWINPTVSGPAGTKTFKGTNYNIYTVTWSTGQAWANGASGVVPAGVRFHVGATFSGVDFNTPDPIILDKVTLKDGGGAALPLQPRMVAYDSGAFDSSDGSFNVRLFNADALNRELIVRNLEVLELPRVASIDSMLSGAELKTWQGLPVSAWRAVRPLVNVNRESSELRVADVEKVRFSKLSEKRHVVQRSDPSGCRTRQPGTGPVKVPGDSNVLDWNDCEPSGKIQVALFPATTVLVRATVVDPNAKYWDPVQAKFVTGPLESKLFYQFGGRHPDLNHNGVDDYIDIAQGNSRDVNGDGVPDEIQPGAGPSKGDKDWWWLLLLLLLLLIILLLVMFRLSRKHP